MSIRNAFSSLALVTLAAITAAGCAGAGSGESQMQGPPLSGEEIRKLIVGNTVKGPIGAQPYSFYYFPDGKVSGVIGDDDDDSGTWQIKNGDVFCFTWIDFFDGTQECYQWYRDGSRYTMVSVEADRSSDIPVWSIEQGNPLNF